MSSTYGTLIYSTGDPVVINAEPCTDTGGGVFQITDATRRLLDPLTPISAYDTNDNSEIAILAIDYFNGKVTLASVPVGTVEVDCAYVTKQLIGGSKAYNFELSGDIADATTFASAQAGGGYRSRIYGLHDVSVSLDNYDDLTQKFKVHKNARETVYIEVAPGGGASAIKGWFIVETVSVSGDMGSIEEEGLSFMLANISGFQQDARATVFSFS